MGGEGGGVYIQVLKSSYVGDNTYWYLNCSKNARICEDISILFEEGICQT